MIRRLTEQDHGDALTLYGELIGTTPVEQGAKRFSEILTHSGTTLWGAEREERIVSMATLHLLPNMTYRGRPYALVENVVTLRAFQGQGLGRAVMQALMSDAWQADAYKIMLLTGKSIGASGFYEKLGFTETKNSP